MKDACQVTDDKKGLKKIVPKKNTADKS